MMRSTARSCFTLLALTLAACGAGARGDDTTTHARNAEGEDMICHQEYPTGSNIGRTVCRTEDDRDRDREKARALVSTPAPVPQRRPPPPPTGQ